MRKCCFLTMDNLAGYVSDDELAVMPLHSLGWEVNFVSWRNDSVNWNDFAAVVIRTTWDYHDAPDEFLRVLVQIDNSKAQLENSLDLVRWNLDKRYLRDLESRGVHIVPTIWMKSELTKARFKEWQKELNCDEIIIKPTISATAKDTFRFEWIPDKFPTVLNERSYMVQPFLTSILYEGEYSLFYFGGAYSHTILKKPAEGDFRVQEEHGGIITSIDPNTELTAAADRVMGELPSTPLYARIDLVRDANGRLALMELELIEPALYFRMDELAASRFATAFDRIMYEL